MTTAAPASRTEPAGLACGRDPDGALVVRMTGAWTVGRSLPSETAVVMHLADRPARGLRYDARGLGRWDTSLLAFVRAVEATDAASAIDPLRRRHRSCLGAE